MNYIAINSYRSSTDHGFSNTWSCYRITSEDRKKIIAEGLPVRDMLNVDHTGKRTPAKSRNGIRTATQSEIRQMIKKEKQGMPEAWVTWIEELQSWNFSA